MNQVVLYAERLPDSVQRSHIDWGYHLTALYGTDYRSLSQRVISAASGWTTIANMASIRR